MGKKVLLPFVLFTTLMYAQSIDADLDGFDDNPLEVVASSSHTDDMAGFDDEPMVESSQNDVNESSGKISSDDITTDLDKHEENDESAVDTIISGFTGKLTEQVTYAYNGKKPHNNFTGLKSSLLLDYEHKFENNWRFKINAKAYYDAIYDIRNEIYSQDELDEQRSEIRLYDAYVEGSISEKIDIKLGRQVVVWGRSDTIRITDILNPLDNRRPAIVDIEDLRLPVTMAKLDFFIGDWRITPIAILEQFFSLNPAFGSTFNPLPNPNLEEKKYADVTYALSVGGEFAGWDVNFYAARVRDDVGYVNFSSRPTLVHDKVNMFGTALNVISGSWLLKTELAYLDGLKYTSTQDKLYSRIDALIGVEYNGIADTLISYDISLRHLNNYDKILLNEFNPLEKDTYQQAFRISTDFVNDTINANYLISLFGKKLSEGGFQRVWIKYDLADGINVNVGVVDYIGGSTLFDTVKDSDMIFADISYSF